MAVNSIFYIFVSGIGVLLTVYTMRTLITFVSYDPFIEQKLSVQDVKGWDLTTTVGALIKNIVLLMLFMVQHSVMADVSTKLFLKKIGLEVIDRSIYIIATSLSLLVLINNWQQIPLMIWQIETSTNHLIWWFFTIVHCCMWFSIYGGSLMMDLPELLGMKQVYYHIQGFDHPLRYKSTEVCRVYQHARHPSFLCFFVLFWVHPFMSLDRLLMSIILTLYMVLAWNMDSLDYNYLHKELSRKQVEFARKF